MSKKKGIIVSGYFNPIHKGHIEYFNNAKELADELFVIVNSDHQRALKGSKEFQQEVERVFIVSNTIPERPICDQMGITLVDGLGDKIQSSSWLLKN